MWKLVSGKLGNELRARLSHKANDPNSIRCDTIKLPQAPACDGNVQGLLSSHCTTCPDHSSFKLLKGFSCFWANTMK